MRQSVVAGQRIAGGRRRLFTMGELFTPGHMIILAIVLVVLFGGKKLPELGKGLGEGLRGFKEGVKGINDEPTASTKVGETAHTVTPTPKPGDDLKPPAA